MAKKHLIFVFLTALISGVSIFLNKYSVSVIDPYIFTFLKNVVVAIALFSLLFLFSNFNELRGLDKRQWTNLVLIGLIGGSIPFLLFFKGLSLTSSAMGSFIHKTIFVYVGVLAFVFLKEKLSKSVFAASVLLLFGNFLVLKFKTLSFNFGDLLILMATLFWAAENTLSKHVLKELSGNVVAFGRMFFGSIFILLFLAFTNQLPLIKKVTMPQILWVLFTALLLFCYVLTWYNGIKSVKITVATSILLLGSPITTLLSFIFSDSVIKFVEILGILLTLAGISIMVFVVEKSKTQSSFSTA